MKIPHKHCELIKAWADGHEIERYSTTDNKWLHAKLPYWREDYGFRIKQEPKPDRVSYRFIYEDSLGLVVSTKHAVNNLKLTFSGETGELIKAEVIIQDVLKEVRDEVQYITDFDTADRVVASVEKHFGVTE